MFESKQGPDFDGVRWTNHGTIYAIPAMDRIGEKRYTYTYGMSRKVLRPAVPAGE